MAGLSSGRRHRCALSHLQSPCFSGAASIGTTGKEAARQGRGDAAPRRRVEPARRRMTAAPRRILLLLLLPIGDTLFATPTVRALRLSYPKAEITALAYPTNAGILEANPDLDRLLLHPTASTWSGPLAYTRFLRGLRRRKFDLVVEFGPAQGWLRWMVHPRRFRALDFPLWQWFLPAWEATVARPGTPSTVTRLCLPQPSAACFRPGRCCTARTRIG